jgi:hypothetical protein
VNGEERRFGGIGDDHEEFVGGDMGDAIAAANTFLELDSDALKRAISGEGTFDGAKRFEIGEMNGEKERRNRSRIGIRGGLRLARQCEAVRRAYGRVNQRRSGREFGAKSSLQDATESTFIHIAFKHVIRCPHLKTSDSKFFIGRVSKKD